MTVGPYGETARQYLAAGWGSPLPLPAGKKKSPPEGWTGRDAPDASAADVEAWCEEHAAGNIGMRLREGIIGIDVDAHKGQRAAAAWTELVGRLGLLPDSAPWCTSRDDGVSGIRLFRVPPGYMTPGVIGAAGEVIQRHHRYVVVPPSVSPPPPLGTGQPYRWVNRAEGEIPQRWELPVLPTTWQEALRAGSGGSGAQEEDSGSTWTDPVLDQLAAHGIPDGANQDEYLRDLTFKLACQEVSREVVHAVWLTVISRTRLARPGEPWTDADFRRHWRGARAKARSRAARNERVVVDLPPPPEIPADLLDSVHVFLGRFVAYPSAHAHVAHTLWVAHTHLMDAWESTPRIAFLSPEPGSGKTRALEVSELLVQRPVEAINTTPAYLFRKVSDPEGLPVILHDEVDTLFGPRTAKDNEEIRGLLNAGHRRGAMAGRCVVKGKNIETEELPAYCAVALAGLGDLPDTLMSRAVVVRMRRRAPGEIIEPFRRRVHKPDGHALRDQLAAWSAQYLASMNGTWPEMPDGIEDRNADVWEALLAVADAAGGHWPDTARVAAVALVADSKAATPSLGIRLLADLRDVFAQVEAMSTEAVLNALRAIEEAPWDDLKGKPLNARGLAMRLRQYGIRSVVVRIGDSTPHGYRRADLYDAWSRYLDNRGVKEEVVGVAAKESATSATNATETACTSCGQPLDPQLAALGETTHPNCGAWPPGTLGEEQNT